MNHFAQEQLLKREQRLQSPELQMKLERTRQLLSEDFGRICKNLLDGSWRITLGAPLSSLWEGTKELGDIVGHNFQLKIKKKREAMEKFRLQ